MGVKERIEGKQGSEGWYIIRGRKPDEGPHQKVVGTVTDSKLLCKVIQGGETVAGIKAAKKLRRSSKSVINLCGTTFTCWLGGGHMLAKLGTVCFFLLGY